MKKAMSFKNPAIWFAAAALTLSACAGHGSYRENEKAEYWMKDYPGASQAKVNECYRKADVEYDKRVSNTAWGNNGGAVLAKGRAWEKCMEAGT